MDVLADFLNTIGASAHIDSVRVREAPWSFDAKPSSHVVFYAVTAGDCCVCCNDSVTELTRGDALFLTQGISHQIEGIGKSPTSIVSGRVTFLAGSLGINALGLPSTFSMRVNKSTSTVFESLAAETDAGRPGWELVSAGLAFGLFIEAIRNQSTASCEGGNGWLRGLDDQEIGTALQLMHSDPVRRWTVAELASELSISRSTFAARFKSITGRPPLEYLTWWRLHRAAARLRRKDGATISQIARDSGYDSDVSFGKAFRREFGKPPGELRRESGVKPASPLQFELKKRDPFDVPEQETGLNLARTAAVLRADHEVFFSRHGLDGSSYNILRILRGAGIPLPKTEVSARLVVPHPNPAEMYDEVVRMGFIEFGADGESVSITNRGLEILAALDGTLIDTHRRQLGHLTSGELAELNRLLVKARRRES